MTKPIQLNWTAKYFNQLTTNELYELIKLRIDIFVVEQTCYYPDLDEKDRHGESLHLCGYDGDKLVAYARILPNNLSFKGCSSIGRVALLEDYRGQGLADILVAKSIELCQTQWPELDIKIGAQSHLTNLYRRHGFEIDSDEYLEDGIPHINMLKK